MIFNIELDGHQQSISNANELHWELCVYDVTVCIYIYIYRQLNNLFTSIDKHAEMDE
jgi:hypothetical protein